MPPKKKVVKCKKVDEWTQDETERKVLKFLLECYFEDNFRYSYDGIHFAQLLKIMFPNSLKFTITGWKLSDDENTDYELKNENSLFHIIARVQKYVNDLVEKYKDLNDDLKLIEFDKDDYNKIIINARSIFAD